MQRVTITLDDDLLETLDSRASVVVITTVPKLSAIFCGVPGAGSYPAARHARFRGAVVWYEHEKRDLASRIVSTQHHHPISRLLLCMCTLITTTVWKLRAER